MNAAAEEDFHVIVQAVLFDRVDLAQYFSIDEKKQLDLLRHLELAARCFYLRLFHRKGPWFAIANDDELFNVAAMDQLLNSGWIHTLEDDDIHGGVEAVEKCLNESQITELLTHVHGGLKFKKVAGKAKMVQYLKESVLKQKRVDGSAFPLTRQVRYAW